MKTFLLLIISILSITSISAQYTVTDDDGIYTITNGGTVNVELPNATDISELYFRLHSDNSVDIVFQTVSANQPANAANSACVGESCYLPNTYGQNQEPLDGSNEALLKLEYSPNGETETATVNYKVSQFFASQNQFTFTVIYTISTSINELNINKLNAFPNPANDKVKISYFAKEDAQLVFYNIVGEQVIKREISAGMNNIDVETAGVPAGTYFYSVVSDSKTTKTKRLVIKH